MICTKCVVCLLINKHLLTVLGARRRARQGRGRDKRDSVSPPNTGPVERQARYPVRATTRGAKHWAKSSHGSPYLIPKNPMRWDHYSSCCVCEGTEAQDPEACKRQRQGMNAENMV